MCSYGASKAAVDHLTRNMAFDVGADNIRVNAIAPGAIRTDALAKVLTPEGLAELLREVQYHWDDIKGGTPASRGTWLQAGLLPNIHHWSAEAREGQG